ncbi:hypothetical protein DSB74_26935, partial [Salmonella enterica subsp. enterica serovar Typhimurium]
MLARQFIQYRGGEVRIVTQRARDFLHKLTHSLTCENQALAVEDLNVRGMMAAPKPKPDADNPG